MAGDDKERKGRWQGFDFGGGGSGNGGGSTPRSPWRFSVSIHAVIAVAILWFVQSSLTHRSTAATMNEFSNQLKAGQVTSVNISPTSITWTNDAKQQLTASLIPGYDPTQLTNQLTQRNIKVTGTQPSALTGYLLNFGLTALLLVGLWVFLFRRMGGGGAAALNLGKNKIKIYDRKEMKTTFSDVAGVDEAVEELEEIVEFLRNPKKYQRLGGRIPKGVLLLGPPGCGKTLLARAVAGEAGVPFFFMSGSEFVEMFVGLGAARVRELFSQAKEKAPCLVFLDELDTIGKSRAGALGGSLGSHDEREQTLNQLLVEMDGFDSSKGVIIMAATNRSDVLDPALIRPGRFDRQVVVDPPDLNGRDNILKVHTRGVALDPSVDLRVLASRTPGFTGADLANVVNEAALLAARREKNAVGMAELEEAIDRTVAGLERKSRVLSDKEKRRVAVHEMGHALAALGCKNIDPVHRVSIIPRGAAALGMTMVRPLEDRHIMTKDELDDRMTFALGGRVAEEIVFGDLSTGAADDLHRATDIARAMIMDYGMSEKLGPVAFGQSGRAPDGRPLFPGEGPQISAGTAQAIDEEIRALVDQSRDRATVILKGDRELLDKLSEVLISREVLEGLELRKWVNGEEPIPGEAELQREVDERKAADADADAAGNGRNGRKAETGPDIIQSRAGDGAGPDLGNGDRRQPVSQEIPPRPD